MSAPDGPTPEQRAAFRAFVRAHHPDRGGDPAAFAAGVDRLRAGARAADIAADDAADDAADPAGTPAPLPLPVRVGVALIRTWRRRHERR